MSSLVAWFLGKTKIGGFVKKAQDFLDGKKQLLAGLATAVPPSLEIIQHFQQGGLNYLMGITHSPEYLIAAAGWAVVYNALKGEKIRKENAIIIDQNNQLLAKADTVVEQTADPVKVAVGVADVASNGDPLVTRPEMEGAITEAVPPPRARNYP